MTVMDSCDPSPVMVGIETGSVRIRGVGGLGVTCDPSPVMVGIETRRRHGRAVPR